MDISSFFKSIIDTDCAPIVVCDTNHKIVYMNPSGAKKYEKSGGYALVGRSLLECHNSNSNAKIEKILKWFEESENNNKLHTFYNEKENKDVYMIALRNEDSKLIGYYEKHEYRNRDGSKFYDLD